MSLTVKGLGQMFPSIERKDIEEILGTKNYKGTDIVTAQNVAKYTGKFSMDLSVFFAKNDTDNFVPLLNGARQKNVMEAAGINPQQVDFADNNKQQNDLGGAIPMDISVFDIEAKRRNMG